MFSTDINHWLQEFENGFINWLLNIVTLLGFVPFLLIIALIIIAAVNFRYGFIIVNFLGWTVIFTILLKEAINYPRPIEVDKSFKDLLLFPMDLAGDVRGDDIGKSGFPSGHTSFQTAIWIGLSLLLRKKWLWIMSTIVILLTVISRLYLAHHFLADVLAGFAIGLVTTFFLYWLVRKAGIDKAHNLSRYQQLFFLAPLLLVLFYPIMPIAQLGRFIGLNLAFIALTYNNIPTLDPAILKRILNLLIFLLIYSLFFIVSMWLDLSGNGLVVILSYALLNFISIYLAALASRKLRLMHF